MAQINFLKSKIHGATVTEANVDYQGSIGIDADLMEAARLREYEKVLVADLTSGARLETYVIRCEPGTGAITMNGAAAHLIREKHKVIVFSWIGLNEAEIADYHPIILFMNEDNSVAQTKIGEINAPVEL